MPDLLKTGLSGLLAFQRSLDTTSHNIANVGTDGYSRQRVEIGTRPAQPYGNGWVGLGASAQTTRRVYDDFVAAQTRTTSSSLEHLDIFSSSTERLNNMFGASSTGLTATLQKFVNAFQGVANSPTSIPARQVLLSEANTLQQRLQYFDDRLADMDAEVNQRLTGEIAEINSLAQGIARLNNDITVGYARTGGQPPNDLLDERDRLLDQLAQKVSVNAVKQDGGAVNVFVGNGQPLVLGAQASQLSTVQDQFDPTQLGVALRTQNGVIDVTRNITGGQIGGILDFRREQLDPAHNALGRISVALQDLVNEQHGAGMDLANRPGGQFFAIGAVDARESALNTGSASIDVSRIDSKALTDRDYILERTGGGWALRDSRTGASVTMTGSGTAADPYVADGLSIEVSGAAAVGDEFLIRPTRAAVEGLQVLVTDPSRVAAALPGASVRTSAPATNTGSGVISAGVVLDEQSLRPTATISFTSPTTYTISGDPTVHTYTAGADIDANGWRVQITGAPAAGDVFTVAGNSAGVGDNRNALAMANALSAPWLNNSTTTLSSAVGEFVGGIGVATRQAQVNRDAQQVVHDENVATLDSISGVNLDEEAANLLRYQQAYQAAAQLIRVADTLFQTLLSATDR